MRTEYDEILNKLFNYLERGEILAIKTGMIVYTVGSIILMIEDKEKAKTIKEKAKNFNMISVY